MNNAIIIDLLLNISYNKDNIQFKKQKNTTYGRVRIADFHITCLKQ